MILLVDVGVATVAAADADNDIGVSIVANDDGGGGDATDATFAFSTAAQHCGHGVIVPYAGDTAAGDDAPLVDASNTRQLRAQTPLWQRWRCSRMRRR
jgi:hypothetical protein